MTQCHKQTLPRIDVATVFDVLLAPKNLTKRMFYGMFLNGFLNFENENFENFSKEHKNFWERKIPEIRFRNF